MNYILDSLSFCWMNIYTYFVTVLEVFSKSNVTEAEAPSIFIISYAWGKNHEISVFIYQRYFQVTFYNVSGHCGFYSSNQEKKNEWFPKIKKTVIIVIYRTST